MRAPQPRSTICHLAVADDPAARTLRGHALCGDALLLVQGGMQHWLCPAGATLKETAPGLHRLTLAYRSQDGDGPEMRVVVGVAPRNVIAAILARLKLLAPEAVRRVARNAVARLGPMPQGAAAPHVVMLARADVVAARRATEASHLLDRAAQAHRAQILREIEGLLTAGGAAAARAPSRRQVGPIP